jgi:hypothetical protein
MMLTNVRNVISARMYMALSVGILWAATANAASFKDRIYRLGDDPTEAPGEGNQVDTNYDIGNTADSEYVDLAGTFYAYHDLYSSAVDAVGNPGALPGPTYTRTDATGRPLAGAVEWGVSFDGVDDYLYINGLHSTQAVHNGTGGMGFPQQADNQALYWTATERVRNYDNLTQRYMAGWVRPTGSTATGRQDIVADTDQLTIFISAPDGMNKRYWGLTHGPATTANDGEITVSETEVTFGQWYHVMHTSGIGGNDGILYVNGIAVAAEGQNATTNPGDATWNYNFVMGSGVDKTSNRFAGQIDDFVVGLSGNNSTVAGPPMGMNWGTFNLAEDNDYIADFMDGKPAGDVNLDGVLNQLDIDVFVENWLTEKTVNGVDVGDLETRMNGDLDFNGAINLNDAFILRSAIVPGSGVVFEFGNLVPEPTSVALALFGMLSLVGVRRRRG